MAPKIFRKTHQISIEVDNFTQFKFKIEVCDPKNNDKKSAKFMYSAILFEIMVLLHTHFIIKPYLLSTVIVHDHLK